MYVKLHTGTFAGRKSDREGVIILKCQAELAQPCLETQLLRRGGHRKLKQFPILVYKPEMVNERAPANVSLRVWVEINKTLCQLDEEQALARFLIQKQT
jgi:hypothetical protein